MNYLGIDYGQKRIGLSICHGDIGIPLPMEAIIFGDDGEKIAKIREIIDRERINGIAIGYPWNMDGSVGSQAIKIDEFIGKLGANIPDCVKIHRVDERLTSEQAEYQAHAIYTGQSPAKKRRQRKFGVVDSRAATIILQDFLDQFKMP